jgi:CRISPR-associated endonuclease/helicase Cas3
MGLYPYQTRVKELIQGGKSVILQAPTGAGKTRAALAPFIESFFNRPAEKFPRRCVYTVPMRVLAHQFVNEYREYAEHYRRVHRREINVTIQTGDQPNDRRFEGDLVFCTIDQFLSSYLTMPYSLPRRWANLNAGAMVGAYLVFDEFHLLDPNSTLPTVLYALKQLHPVAPVLLMTATFSREMLDTLAGELSAEVVLVPQDEARAIEMRDNAKQLRQRVWNVSDVPLSAQAVLAAHQSRSLAICNTVKRAQELFRELRQVKQERNLQIHLLLLHSRFLQEDRRKIEDTLKARFGKEADRGGSVVAVATQTIEVGVDITSEILHTELAPASAMIQRAGRCARFPGEQGHVIVYPVEEYLPYGKAKDEPGDEPTWVAEMKSALDWLKANAGKSFDFETEQALVNTVATPRDRQILEELSAGRQTRADAIQRVLVSDRERLGSDSRLLVRDADSRLALIHANPDELSRNPLGATGFNLPTLTLYGMIKSWMEREADVEWRVKYLLEDRSDERADEYRTEYGWKELTDASLLWSTRALVVNPALAGYWSDEGFVAEQGGSQFQSSLPPDAERQTWEGAPYRLESYEEHIRCVLNAFERLVLPEIQFSARALEQAANWQAGSVLRAAWLVCLFHDVGKLDKRWQNWARAYQNKIDRPMQPGFAAAHTDSDPRNEVHEKAEKAIHGKYPKPPHASQSARAVGLILARALDRNEMLVRAAITAISRHHAPFAEECKSYVLESQAGDHVQASLKFVPEEVRQGIDLKSLKDAISNDENVLRVRPDETWGWLAYTLLARGLRRADQEGTAMGSKEG